MSHERPMVFQWDGDAMIPRSPRMADKTYVVGEVYTLVPHEDRSPASHSHEFAWLKEAWKNLPENLADLYPTPEALRKRALISAGYYDETIVDAGSAAAAIRVAAAFRQIDDFALVIVRGVHVIRRTAKSQSRRAMNKEEFQASKTAIIEIVSGMIGVKPGELANASEAAA
jgi:hypothetical protein